jgi:hypothetical protein
MNRRSRRINFKQDFLAKRQKFIINDIDLPLFKYGLIDRHNLIVYCKGKRIQRIQSYKSYLFIVSYIFNTIRYMFYIIDSVDGKVPDSYLDISQYFGGITQFHHLEVISALILTLVIVIHFNYSNDLNWIEIIETLKGSQSMARFGVIETKPVEKFINKVKLMKFLIQIVLYSIIFSEYLLSIVVTIVFYDFNNIVKYGIVSFILFNAIVFSVFPILSYSFLYYYTVSSYCRMRFRLYNEFLRMKSSGKSVRNYSLIIEILEKHNSIINAIESYNKFWKIYYFAITYTLIPFNLMLLQQILFEDLNIFNYLSYSSISIGCLGLHSILNLIAASVYKESAKSHKCLYEFYLNSKSLINIKHKIKV